MTSVDAFFELYQRPGFLLRRAHRISVAIFERECAAIGLTPAQYGALYVLHHAPGIDQSTLARAMGLDRVTILRVARGLESRGLVVRQAQAPSRRLSLTLTTEGENLFLQARPLARRALQRLTSPLEPAEQDTLMRLLNKMCDALEADARAEVAPPQAPQLPSQSSPGPSR